MSVSNIKELLLKATAGKYAVDLIVNSLEENGTITFDKLENYL